MENYVTSLPERDLRNFRPLDFCCTECTYQYFSKVRHRFSKHGPFKFLTIASPLLWRSFIEGGILTAGKLLRTLHTYTHTHTHTLRHTQHTQKHTHRHTQHTHTNTTHYTTHTHTRNTHYTHNTHTRAHRHTQHTHTKTHKQHTHKHKHTYTTHTQIHKNTHTTYTHYTQKHTQHTKKNTHTYNTPKNKKLRFLAFRELFTTHKIFQTLTKLIKTRISKLSNIKQLLKEKFWGTPETDHAICVVHVVLLTDWIKHNTRRTGPAEFKTNTNEKFTNVWIQYTSPRGDARNCVMT